MVEGRGPRRAAALLAAALCALLVAVPTATAAPSTAWNGTTFNLDTANVVRRANIVLGSPPLVSSQLMGLGNGQLGASMSEREVRDLVASFDKVGKKADCIEALEGSGVTVPADLKR